MSALVAAQRLERVAMMLRAGMPPSSDDAAWLADGIDRYFSERGSLDIALGLSCTAGQHHPGEGTARRRRDAYLREAAAMLPQDCNRVAKLGLELRRYYRSSWHRQRKHDEVPQQIRGTIQEKLWRALQAWPRELKDGQIRIILFSETDLCTERVVADYRVEQE